MKNPENESSEQHEESIDLMNETAEPSNFEDAIKATGFGKFNIILLCTVVAGAFAQIVEQTSNAYVTPIAECDLELTLENKGLLVSISYTGMIMSSFLWGYICDTYGRRKVIIYGYILNAACYLLAALSQNFTTFLITKFFSGFIYTGPFTAFTSYLSEFHSSEYRSRVQLIRGTASGIAVIVLPMVAWIILPHIYEISLMSINLHSWNFFVAICCIPALTTGVTFVFLPESPKFLMASGKTTKALTVFKKVYKTNTGRRFSSFPIKMLVEESVHNPQEEKSNGEKSGFIEGLKNGFLSVKPLFGPPYFLKLLHASVTAGLLTTGAFSVKMWYPQILQAINDYGKDKPNEDPNICDILNSLAYRNTSENAVCTVNLDNSSVYINASILGAVQLVSFILAGFAVTKTGKKPLTISLAAFSASCPVIIYFISNGAVMMTLFPIIVAFAEVCANLLLTITMELFPTSFRTMATNLNMMIVRIGIFSGNVVLPYLLQTGCVTTLTFISVAIFATAFLTYLLPNTDNKDLE